jgi:hypothetical protein
MNMYIYEVINSSKYSYNIVEQNYFNSSALILILIVLIKIIIKN